VGDVAAARPLYLHAFLLDPWDPALHAVRDVDVRALPDTVRFDVEIEDDPAAWAAPAGILFGVLPRPASDLTELPPPPDALLPHQRAALADARAFVVALVAVVAASGDTLIELRRAMKRLSPKLFERYMGRIVRRSAG
jgi:hypothetical protein